MIAAWFVALVVAMTGGLVAQPAHASGTDGTPEAAFNAHFPYRGIQGTVLSTARTSDGSVIVDQQGAPVEKFSSTGVQDSTFAANLAAASIHASSPAQVLLVGNALYWSGVLYADAPSRFGIVKFDLSGTPDTGFNPQWDQGNTGQYPSQIAAAPDGSIVALSTPGGRNFGLSWFSPTDGTRTHEAIFANPSGRATMAVDPDGSVVVATATSLLRFTIVNGSVVATTVASLSGCPNTIAIDGNHSILFATGSAPFVTMLNSDGTTTGTAATFATNLGASLDGAVEALTIDGAGSIVVGGAFTGGLKKLSSVGTVDTLFTTQVGTTVRGTVSALSTSADGTIVASGPIPSKVEVVSGSGVKDSVFEANVTPVLDGQVTAVVKDSLGNIYAAGQFTGGLKKFTSAGVEDGTFTQNLANRFAASRINAVLALPDGSLLIGGASFDANNPGSSTYFLTGLNSDGSASNAFSSISSGLDGPIYSLVLDGTSVLIGGQFTGQLKKATLNGAVDASFAANADPAIVSTGDAPMVESIAVLSDGSILVGGNFQHSLLKFNSDGSTTGTAEMFNANIRSGYAAATPEVGAIAVSPTSGDILVSDVYNYTLTKLHANGTIDTGTDGNGHTFTDNTGPVVSSGPPNAAGLVVLADNSILVGGAGLRQLNADGAFDPAAPFNANVGSSLGTSPWVNALAVLSDGAVIAGGEFPIPGDRLAKFAGSVPSAGGAGGTSGGGGSSDASGSGGTSTGTSPSSTGNIVPPSQVAAPVALGSVPGLPASGLAPGASALIVGGVPSSVTITPDAGPGTSSHPVAPHAATGLAVTGSGFSLHLAGLDASGTPLGLSSDAALVLQPDNTTAVSGTGFRPGSNVQLYVFSTARLLGAVTTDAQGNFSGTVPIPTDLNLGHHTLQVNGYTSDGQVRSLSLGVILQAPKVAPGRRIARATVFFLSGSTALNKAAQATLLALARTVGAKSGSGIVIGYVQRDNSMSNDTDLSMARARTIARYLRSHGVKARLATRGNGALTAQDTARKATVTIGYAD